MRTLPAPDRPPPRRRAAFRPWAAWVLCWALGVGMAGAAHAADAPGGGRWIVSFENDTMSHPSSDRDYTMGLSVSRSYAGAPKPPWARTLLAALQGLHGDDAGGAVASWWEAGTRNFTPKNIKRKTPIPDDRPYASLLYVSAGYVRQQSADSWVETELQLGLLGTNAGKIVQTDLHHVFPSPGLPEGWDHQIGAGGSATFLYHLGANRLLTGARGGPAKYRLTGGAGTELGYYVRAFAHLTLHLGDTRTTRRAWRPDASSLDLNRYGVAAAVPGDAAPVWIAYGVSAFAYNELLQGAWSGTNDVTIAHSDMETWVHQASIGIDLSFVLRFLGLPGPRLVYSEQWRSQQLKTLHGRSQYWGGLYLSWVS